MKFSELSIPGAFLIEGEPLRDSRGYFARTFDSRIFKEHGLIADFVQESEARNLSKHTVRGLHFQRSPHAETKLIRVVSGAIFEVILDLRSDLPSFGQHCTLHLSQDNFSQVWIPKGCAHGFCTLSDDVVVLYKMDAVFVPDSQAGVVWDDGDLKIPWPTQQPILSDKDKRLPKLKELPGYATLFK